MELTESVKQRNGEPEEADVIKLGKISPAESILSECFLGRKDGLCKLDEICESDDGFQVLRILRESKIVYICKFRGSLLEMPIAIRKQFSAERTALDRQGTKQSPVEEMTKELTLSVKRMSGYMNGISYHGASPAVHVNRQQ